MEAYQEMMLTELRELNERVDKLHNLFGDKDRMRDIPVEKLDLMLKQYHYMSMYETVLRQRCGLEGIL